MSARQLQDLLSSVVKLPVAANASAAAVSAVSANPGSAAAVAAAAVVVSAARPASAAATAAATSGCQRSHPSL